MSNITRQQATRACQNCKKGQTLFEMVIALAVVVLVITGIVKAVTTAIKNSTFARNKSEATRYGQEALEWVKTERDKKSWSNFTANVGNLTTSSGVCMPTLVFPTSSSSCDTSLDSNKIQNAIFFREIKVLDEGTSSCTSSDTSCNITVEVFWLDGETTHTSTLETRMTNWR